MNTFAIVITGIVATGVVDIWQQALKRGAGLPIANWGLIGRWVAEMARGVFVHRPITDASPVEHEDAIGCVFHYLVGVAYSGLYLLIVKTAASIQASSTRWRSASSRSPRPGL